MIINFRLWTLNFFTNSKSQIVMKKVPNTLEIAEKVENVEAFQWYTFSQNWKNILSCPQYRNICMLCVMKSTNNVKLAKLALGFTKHSNWSRTFSKLNSFDIMLFESLWTIPSLLFTSINDSSGPSLSLGGMSSSTSFSSSISVFSTCFFGLKSIQTIIIKETILRHAPRNKLLKYVRRSHLGLLVKRITCPPTYVPSDNPIKQRNFSSYGLYCEVQTQNHGELKECKLDRAHLFIVVDHNVAVNCCWKACCSASKINWQRTYQHPIRTCSSIKVTQWCMLIMLCITQTIEINVYHSDAQWDEVTNSNQHKQCFRSSLVPIQKRSYENGPKDEWHYFNKVPWTKWNIRMEN